MGLTESGNKSFDSQNYMTFVP
ncbi:hypothetical protein EVA_00561, partial [gut metagenome]